jgi:hypothetical protein
MNFPHMSSHMGNSHHHSSQASLHGTSTINFHRQSTCGENQNANPPLSHFQSLRANTNGMQFANGAQNAQMACGTGRSSLNSITKQQSKTFRNTKPNEGTSAIEQMPANIFGRPS